MICQNNVSRAGNQVDLAGSFLASAFQLISEASGAVQLSCFLILSLDWVYGLRPGTPVDYVL